MEVEVIAALDRTELRHYRDRVNDRWPLEVALLGGARVADERGEPPQRERGPEFVVVLVSSAYEGLPWLERVHLAGSLWDGYVMGARPDVHCYTPPEYERKCRTMSVVRETAWHGLNLLAI